MVVSICLMGVLVMLHQLQRRGKPRLFLSRFFRSLHDDHDYFVGVDKAMAIELEDVCSICFETLEEKKIDWTDELPELSSNLLEYIQTRDTNIMRTPCNHYFHTGCLVSVMNFKMLCPICRQPLPNIA